MAPTAGSWLSASTWVFCGRPAPFLLTRISSEEKEGHLVAQTPQDPGSALTPARVHADALSSVPQRAFFSYCLYRAQIFLRSKLQDTNNRMLLLLFKTAAMAGDLTYSIQSWQRLRLGAHGTLRFHVPSQEAFQEIIPQDTRKPSSSLGA